MKLVMISGKQGSGKTTLARELGAMYTSTGMNHIRLLFAEPLYELHDACLPILKKHGVIPGDTKKEGPLLQVLGTEYGRRFKGANTWVDIIRRRVDLILEVKGHCSTLVTIEDCRFENEFLAFPDALRVRLEAPESVRRVRAEGWRESTNHESETGLDEFAKNGAFDLCLDTALLMPQNAVGAVARALALGVPRRP